MAIKFLNTVQVDTDVLYVDTTNDRVGIGTDNPSARLDISTTGTGDSIIIRNNDTSSSAAPVFVLKRDSSSPANGDYLGQLKFKGENDASQEIVYAKITAKTSDVTDGTEDGLIETAVKSDGSNLIVSRQTGTDLKLINGVGLEVDGDVQFGAYGAGTLVTDANGNISVSSGGGAGGPYLPLAGGTMTGDVIFPGEEANSFKIAFTGASASSGISTVDQSGAGLYIGANSRVNNSGSVVFHDTLLPSSGIYFDGWSGDDMEFYTGSSGNPTKRLTIEAGGDAIFTGNVGIGEDNPSAKLYVKGGANDDVIARFKTTGAGTSDYSQIDVANNVNQILRLGSVGSNYANSALAGMRYIIATHGALALKAQASDGNVRIYTGSTINERMRITSGGELIINGTTSTYGVSQGYPLHVKGTSSQGYVSICRGTQNSGSEGLIVGTDQSNAYLLSRDNIPLVLGNNNQSLVFIKPGGNVGIGKTSPDFKLDVGGTFGVSDLPFNTDSVSVLVADETIGAELVTNGDFATDSDWTKDNGWAIGSGTANGTSAVTPIYQTISGFTAGNVYKVRFEVTAVTSGYIRVYAYVGANGNFTNIFNSTSLTTGVYEGTFEFGGTNKILRFYGSVNSTGGFTGSIDNISVKEVTSASNQIQKRELGTGAFGPTPVGAYLPLAGGTLTGALNGTSATFSGDVTLANGNSLRWTSDDVRIEATTASDNMKFYVGGSEILKLEQSGTLATFAGTVTAATYYKSSGTSVVLGTNASGEVLLRPVGWNLSTAQSSFTSTLATSVADKALLYILTVDISPLVTVDPFLESAPILKVLDVLAILDPSLEIVATSMLFT
jgi:hypothetical protein